MNADHELLLFYCAVRWLSKGNVLCRVFELRKELKEFLQLQKKDIFVAALNDENWCKQLAYLADIFGHLNKLNLKRQGTELNVITFKNTLHGFIAKLQNWRRNVDLGNTAMFENVSDLHGSGIDPAEQLKSAISQHLHGLKEELNCYYPDMLDEEEINLAKNPFASQLHISKISDDFQDELLEMRNDFSAYDLFLEKPLSQFWVSVQRSYTKISMAAFKIITSFVSTYVNVDFLHLFKSKRKRGINLMCKIT